MRNSHVVIITVLLVGIITSCSLNSKKIPDSQLLGVWRLEGRSMYDNMYISIVKENNQLQGRVLKKNANKYVQMFVDSNAVWFSEITRKSNYEFICKENKVGKELFAQFDVPTTQEIRIQFVNDTIIGCAFKNEDPLKSKVRMVKVNE